MFKFKKKKEIEKDSSNASSSTRKESTTSFVNGVQTRVYQTETVSTRRITTSTLVQKEFDVFQTNTTLAMNLDRSSQIRNTLPFRTQNVDLPKSTFFNKPTTTSTSSILKKPINLNYQSPYRNDATVFRSAYSPLKPATHSSRPTNWSSTPNSTNNSKTNSTTSLPSTLTSTPTTKSKLTVKKTGKRYDSVAGALPVYKTSGKQRGQMLIINNINFRNSDERKGAKKDQENMQKVFQQLNFGIETKNDLKAEEMKQAVKNFSKKSSLRNVDMIVVVIMSHGVNVPHLSGTQIEGCDGRTISTDEVLEYFTAENCAILAGKPKIFLFQCCRSYLEIPETDAKLFGRTIGHSDMLIAFSTLPGFNSHRNPKEGTWYILTLCEVITEFAHELHFEELLKIVDDRVGKFEGAAQRTTYESRGFKRCYLHP